jgi:hypothetical protein
MEKILAAYAVGPANENLEDSENVLVYIFDSLQKDGFKVGQYTSIPLFSDIFDEHLRNRTKGFRSARLASGLNVKNWWEVVVSDKVLSESSIKYLKEKDLDVQVLEKSSVAPES